MTKHGAINFGVKNLHPYIYRRLIWYRSARHPNPRDWWGLLMEKLLEQNWNLSCWKAYGDYGKKILADLKLTGLGERMYAPVFMKHIIKNDNTEAVLHVNLLVWTVGVTLFPAAERKVAVEKGKRTSSLWARPAWDWLLFKYLFSMHLHTNK